MKTQSSNFNSSPEIENQSEFQKFDAALGKALSVSRAELRRREAEWKKQRKAKKRAKA